MADRPEDAILAHYDRALRQYGDTAQGALWPNAKDRLVRYDVMLDVIANRGEEPIVLCDLGCGTGELLARIRERDLRNIIYIGVDRSREALAFARAKFPDATFHELDVTAPGADLTRMDCDYLVANGLFTVKHVMTHEQMRNFLETTIRNVWPRVRRGIAFNVMSKVVDWEREDLFHASMDDMAQLLHGLAGRRVRMRADYGLYEFTCYAYKHDDSLPSGWNAGVDAHDSAPAEVVRVMRPLLPKAEKLRPYLERIDASRIYSNFGPLVIEFEGRLTRHFGLPAGGMVTSSTGTAGLVGAILAQAGRARPDRELALMPAFTFVATAVAAQLCGYSPYLADVDANNWLLDPEKLLKHPQLDRIGVVIPVAAFGRPVLQAPWRAFYDKTGIPVVIDGAAGFEAISAHPERYLGPIPVMMSLHATKSMATGEGGCVATTDIGLAALIGQAFNYGFHYTRDSCSASTNGKMSEYHAAVGLAEMDGWEQKKQAFRNVVASYHRQIFAAGLGSRLVTAPDICSSYVLFRCADAAESQRVQDGLRLQGIEYRLWYGQGLQQQTYFATCEHDDLSVTERIAPCLLGLPMATDLTDAMIAQVVQGLRNGLAGIASPRKI
jgi:dTDP-4-amino-4,6-dideoxygalactose transaminase